MLKKTDFQIFKKKFVLCGKIGVAMVSGYCEKTTFEGLVRPHTNSKIELLRS